MSARLLVPNERKASFAELSVLSYGKSRYSSMESQSEKCNSGSLRFVEYWVPAQLSSLQLEQYCSMLLSNSMLLCSSQKSDLVDALRDLLISTRKCCNHPFLLDESLHDFVIKGRTVEEHLDIDIKASGKLQLLEKILFEARSRELRVIILFQSSGGSGSVGDILDDVLFRRFGEDCYVRYGRGYIPSKKQAALDTFNDRESGKFVFLMENRACLPSIKLSSVDTIILFDSDWDPQNDLRCLQKMSISSKLKEVTVFRLYTSFTVEEKILMLAKEGVALDSNMQLINQSTSYHTLLKWGASYLFSKLNDLHHGSGSSGSAADIFGPSILNDVMHELSSKLSCGSIDTNSHGQSIISRVQQDRGEYVRNILLPGERHVKKLGSEPHTFSWSDLLKGRNSRWKFLSVSSQRTRKTVKNNDHILKNDPIIRKRSRESEDNAYPKRKKVSKDNVDPKGRKVTKDSVDRKSKKVSKETVSTNKRKLSKGVVDPKTMKVSQDIKRREMSKDKKKRLKKKKNQSAANKKSKLNGTAVMNKQFAKQNKLSGLCDVLHFSENAKAVTMRILEHIFEQYNVNCLGISTLQAFKISVCWLAASLLKHKIDRKGSLDLAKLHLNFGCTEEEATDVYCELQKHEKDFSGFLQNGLCVEKSNINCAKCPFTPELKDRVEEKQKSFQVPHVLNLEKSVTNEHDLPGNSPTTVLSLQDQTCTEMLYSEPNMAHEIWPSQKTLRSLPVEADATSMCSDAAERTNAMASVAAEVSFPEHWNEVPSSSNNDTNTVNPFTGYLERQSPIISTEIAQFDDIVSEDPRTLMNEVIGIVNMSTHPPLPNSAETDTIACDGAAVPEVREWYHIASAACGESTTLEFSECTLRYTHPSHANLMPLSQMSSSASPSIMEDLSSTVMPLDRLVYFSGQDNHYTHEAEEILQAPTDPGEPINSSFILPVTLQPSTYVPINENATNVPHDRYMRSDLFPAHSVTSEIPQVAYPDPLLIEMARITRMNEEDFKICEEKILQLQSEYKEFGLLCEKYTMMLQNANTAVELKKKELERQCKLVLMNMKLAETWVQMPDSC